MSKQISKPNQHRRRIKILGFKVRSRGQTMPETIYTQPRHLTVVRKKSLRDPADSFRKAWDQVQRGELLTEDEFWESVNGDR